MFLFKCWSSWVVWVCGVSIIFKSITLLDRSIISIHWMLFSPFIHSCCWSFFITFLAGIYMLIHSQLQSSWYLPSIDFTKTATGYIIHNIVFVSMGILFLTLVRCELSVKIDLNFVFMLNSSHSSLLHYLQLSCKEYCQIIYYTFNLAFDAFTLGDNSLDPAQIVS